MAGFIYTKEATQVSVMRRLEQQSLTCSWLIAGGKDTEAGRQTVFAPVDYQRIPSPRLHPKVVLKNAWQVQHDKEVQQPRTRVLRETTLKSISVCKQYHRMQHLKIKDERPRFKFWCIRSEHSPEQNLSSSTKRRQGNSIRSLKNPKKTIQSLGKIELFDLGEVSVKIQCPSCAKYWPKRFVTLHLR